MGFSFSQAGQGEADFAAPLPEGLPDLNLEERVIWVRMAPRDVLLLLATVCSIEIAIVAVLLAEILPVRAILIVVPSVVIFALSIVVALFVMISVVSSRGNWSYERGAQY
jgi:hypothetical protein